MDGDDGQKAATDATQGEKHPPEVWWTTFLDALASSGRVAEACRAAGRDRALAYKHRHQYPEFAKAWEEVERHRDTHLADNLLERLTHGVKEDVYYNGKVCGERTVFNEAVAAKFLGMRDPARFSERRFQPEQATGEQHKVVIEFKPQPEVAPDTTKEGE